LFIEKLKTDKDRSDNHCVIEPEKHGGLGLAGTMPLPLIAAIAVSKEGDNRRGLNG
jgi:hypothetical protein